uniref:Putative secreted protein n=1 Tax=Anopheles darlingi TaxID=43151 RepID=A0A2M4D7X0_ANODA
MCFHGAMARKVDKLSFLCSSFCVISCGRQGLASCTFFLMSLQLSSPCGDRVFFSSSTLRLNWSRFGQCQNWPSTVGNEKRLRLMK